ncbi:hypothetical protein CEXT_413761 [Caerostris extrusa]|uniref:Uncharacterized protein n=1 Tax=Caerostris extrusa TaxID=172846 RepID=A0AAV4NBK2_CAEEX|nr:hypothetical protein CEXT_413761 [Caerostris extrusa]
MECVNLLGQGRPVSQIQLATAGWLSPLLSNMECVNFLARVGRLTNTTGYSPGGCLLPIKYGMRQPSWPGPVSQIQLATAGWLSPSYQIWNALTFLARVGRLAKYNWLQPGWLSPSYQIWNALTFFSKVGLLAKYNWLQPG